MIRLKAENPQHKNAEEYDAAHAEDIRGYRLFSQGELGEAHRLAHESFDAGRHAAGHRLLAGFLSRRDGQGSDWVHLQFHMALFELEIGDARAASQRFRNEILPAAATTLDALTDAPALLWRLRMSAAGGADLPWEPLRRTALAALPRGNTIFVDVHNLLALAGAGDAASIERWSPVLKSAGWMRDFPAFCRALARGRLAEAGARLRALRPGLAQLDGSQAQLQLFDQLGRWIERGITGEPVSPVYRHAA